VCAEVRKQKIWTIDLAVIGGSEMESIMLTIKFVMFLAMTLFAIGTLGATLIAGIWKQVQDTIQPRTEIPAGRAHLPTRTE
jgi:hypothetical protein